MFFFFSFEKLYSNFENLNIYATVPNSVNSVHIQQNLWGSDLKIIVLEFDLTESHLTVNAFKGI